MRIAVTYENGQVFPHFGHTQQFKLYDVEEGQILRSMILSTGTEGHEGLATFLKQAGVQLLICGGIGGGAIAALQQAGILLYAGVAGDTDQRVQEFLEGRLVTAPPTCSHGHCGHHEHEHHHENCHHHEGEHHHEHCHHHEGDSCSHGEK